MRGVHSLWKRHSGVTIMRGSLVCAGDTEGLIAVLDPDVVVRIDEAAARPGAPSEIHGAGNWAIVQSPSRSNLRETSADAGQSRGRLVWAPRGHLLRVARFSIAHAKIATVDVIAEQTRLEELELAVLGE